MYKSGEQWQGSRNGLKHLCTGVIRSLDSVWEGLGKVSDGLRRVSHGIGKETNGLLKVSDGLGTVSDGLGNVYVYVYEETWHQVQHETMKNYENIYKWDQCNNLFKNKKEVPAPIVEYHMKCKTCARIFLNTNSLKVHITAIHSKGNGTLLADLVSTFMSQICSWSWSGWYWYWYLYRLIPIHSKSYSCKLLIIWKRLQQLIHISQTNTWYLFGICLCIENY